MMVYKPQKLSVIKTKKDKSLEEIYASALSKVKDVSSMEDAGLVMDSLLQTSPEASAVPAVPTVDKVGSVVQKEEAALSVGLTRKKYIKAIVELLEAGEVRKDWVKEVGDEEGRWVETFVPNLDKRAKGAELAGKFFNDYKEQVVTTGNVYNKVVYQWLSAPSAGVVATRV